MKRLIIIIIYFLLQTATIHCQQLIDKYSISGKGTIDYLSDFYSEGVDINAFSKSFIYSIGYYYGEDYGVLGDKPTEKYNQLNLLCGKYLDSENELFRFQYQGGIGIFWGILRTDELDRSDTSLLTNRYFTKEVTTIGFPIKIGGRYIPFKFLSIGLDLQANLNFQKSILRPLLSLELGKLRSNRE